MVLYSFAYANLLLVSVPISKFSEFQASLWKLTSMGFPVIYSDVFVPSVVVQTLSVLCFLRAIVFSVFASLGLAETESPEPEVYFHESSARIGSQSAASLLIRELLAVVKFSEVGGDAPESCAVCLCEFESGDEIRRLRNCNHIFHRRCLDRWIDNERNTCPLCRASLVPRDLQVEFDKRLRAVSDISRDFSSDFNTVLPHSVSYAS